MVRWSCLGLSHLLKCAKIYRKGSFFTFLWTQGYQEHSTKYIISSINAVAENGKSFVLFVVENTFFKHHSLLYQFF